MPLKGDEVFGAMAVIDCTVLCPVCGCPMARGNQSGQEIMQKQLRTVYCASSGCDLNGVLFVFTPQMIGLLRVRIRKEGASDGEDTG